MLEVSTKLHRQGWRSSIFQSCHWIAFWKSYRLPSSAIWFAFAGLWGRDAEVTISGRGIRGRNGAGWLDRQRGKSGSCRLQKGEILTLETKLGEWNGWFRCGDCLVFGFFHGSSTRLKVGEIVGEVIPLITHLFISIRRLRVADSRLQLRFIIVRYCWIEI